MSGPMRRGTRAGRRLCGLAPALAGEQRPTSTVETVAATFRPGGWITRPPRQNGSRPSRALSRLFYQVQIRYPQLLKS